MRGVASVVIPKVVTRYLLLYTTRHPEYRVLMQCPDSSNPTQQPQKASSV